MDHGRSIAPDSPASQCLSAASGIFCRHRGDGGHFAPKKPRCERGTPAFPGALSIVLKLIEFFQGNWLGHPLHPAVVHAPVGAWTFACAIDLALFAGVSSPVLAHVALYCVGFGLLATLLAVPTGLADWSGIKKEKPAWRIALYHLLFNALAALGWAANFGLRLDPLNSDRPVTAVIFTTSLLATALLIAGAYLGKRLVFAHGISVARLSKDKWRRIAVAGGARVPDGK
jgi:uncharacterized membrane protein